MLLYITAEDVLGAPRSRAGHGPLQGDPRDAGALYDMGMRHHVRRAALLQGGELSGAARLEARPPRDPDRALRAREAGARAGDARRRLRAALLALAGREFAVKGFGAAAGRHRARRRGRRAPGRLREAAPRFVVGDGCRERRAAPGLRAQRPRPRRPLIAADAGPRAARSCRSASCWSSAARPRHRRARAGLPAAVPRRVDPESEALWHVAARGTVRMQPPRRDASASRRGCARGRRSRATSRTCEPPRVTLATASRWRRSSATG